MAIEPRTGDRVELISNLGSGRWLRGDRGTITRVEVDRAFEVTFDLDPRIRTFGPSRVKSFQRGYNLKLVDKYDELSQGVEIIATSPDKPREFRVGDRVRVVIPDVEPDPTRVSKLVGVWAEGVVQELYLDANPRTCVVLWDEAEKYYPNYTIETRKLGLISSVRLFSPGDRVKRINDVGEGYKGTPFARLGDAGKVLRRDSLDTDKGEAQYIISWDDPRYNWTKNYVVAQHEIELVEKYVEVPKGPTQEQIVSRLRHGGFLR